MELLFRNTYVVFLDLVIIGCVVVVFSYGLIVLLSKERKVLFSVMEASLSRSQLLREQWTTTHGRTHPLVFLKVGGFASAHKTQLFTNATSTKELFLLPGQILCILQVYLAMSSSLSSSVEMCPWVVALS